MRYEYWAIDLDNLAESIWDAPELASDVKGAHYMGFTGTRTEVLAKLTEAFGKLIERSMYQASSYGSPVGDGDE